MTQEEKQVAAVIAEARTWKGTPHMHRQMVKGVGVDCALFVMQAFAGAGLAEAFDPGFYTFDWHLHRSEEIYLKKVEEYMGVVDDRPISLEERLVEDPSLSINPGHLIMMRSGRTYSHGAIVTQWPNIIHAYYPEGMVVEGSVLGTPMMKAPAKIYSYWRRPR